MKHLKLLFFLLAFVFGSCEILDEEPNDAEIDTTKPQISVDESVYQTVREKGDTFKITGSATDESELASIRFLNEEWMLDTTIAIGGKSYTIDFEVTIPEDVDMTIRNVVEVEVQDLRKNASEFDVLVNFGTDEIDPVVTINAPAENTELYSGQSFEIDAIIEDNFALETILVEVDSLGYSKTVSASGASAYHFKSGAITIPAGMEYGSYIGSIFVLDMAGNDTTFTFSFSVIESPIVYETIGIIGSATPNGWDSSSPMRLTDPADPTKWEIVTWLVAGEMKFRADNAWTVNWGNNTFPTGNGTQDGPNIPIAEAGYYKITFNDRNGAYTFEKLTDLTEYETVGIIGSATPDGWNSSTAMEKNSENPHSWTIRATLTDGELKFRANNEWTVNWGSNAFPSGNGVQDGENIPVTAGVYDIAFDDVTGNYTFTIVDDQPEEETLFMTGAAINGWDWNNHVQLTRVSAGVFEATFDFKPNEAFRFFAQADWGPVSYNYPYFTSVDEDFENAGDGDQNLKYVGPSGERKVVVDLNAKTVSLPDPEMYMVGGALNGWGWGAGQPVQMTYVSPGVFTATTVLNNNNEAFRFFAQADWGPTSYNYPYFTTVDTDLVNAGDGDSNFKFVGTTGTYTVTLDLNTKTVTVE